MGWENFSKGGGLVIISLIVCFPIILGSIYALFKSAPLPRIRFNRQRREVYIRYKNRIGLSLGKKLKPKPKKSIPMVDMG